MPRIRFAYPPEDSAEFLQYLVGTYHSFVRCVAEKVLENWADADEAVNGLWKSVWRQIDRLKGMENSQLKAYLYRSAVNAARDLMRSRRKSACECVSLESVENVIVTEGPTLEGEEFCPEEIGWLKGWNYKPEQRRLISLVYYEGYTLKEAAQIIGITYGNARTMMSRIFDQIRKIHPDGVRGLPGRKEAGSDEIQQ